MREFLTTNWLRACGRWNTCFLSGWLAEIRSEAKGLRSTNRVSPCRVGLLAPTPIFGECVMPWPLKPHASTRLPTWRVADGGAAVEQSVFVQPRPDSQLPLLEARNMIRTSPAILTLA